MRVMSIGLNTNQSFNGLWGKETKENISQSHYDNAYECEMGTNHKLTVKTYYPFKDETDEYISSVVAKNTKFDDYAIGTLYDASNNINEVRVDVKPRLSFTEDEFKKYKNDDLLSRDEDKIEDALKIRGLKQYLLRNMKRK